jgi:hypothetical protein
MNRTENVKLVLTMQSYLTGDLGVIVFTVYGTSTRSIIRDILYWPQGAQTLEKQIISLYFMKPECSLLCSKESHLSQARTRWIQSSSSHSCNSHLNIILSFTPTSSMFILPFRFSTKTLDTFHPTWRIHANSIWRVIIFLSRLYCLPLVPHKFLSKYRHFYKIE